MSQNPLHDLTFTEPTRVDLADLSTDAPKEALRDGGKEAARAEIERLSPRLEELFDLQNFAARNGLLIVLQGMDAAGKDGAIRHILSLSHAQSCRVANFKVPTPEEAAHDFLWRVHKGTPARGEIVLFNRSHYEDVGVTLVHGLIDRKEADRRLARIRDFETLLGECGTIIVKVWLHVSKGEQEERLLEREKDPHAFWKLSVGDWKERPFWHAYERAYGDAIGATAAPHAPWTVIPADRKWYRDLALTRLLVAALEPHEEVWKSHLQAVGKTARAELAAFRKEEEEKGGEEKS